MSSISSVTDTSSAAYLLLQKTSSAASTTAATTTENTSKNSDGLDALQDKILAAVSEALDGLDTDSDAETVADAVKNAVETTLEENGVDSDTMAPPPPPADGQAPVGPPPTDEDDQEKSDLQSKIDALLEEKGFDVEAFKAQMQASMTSQTSSTNVLNFIQSADGGVDATA